MSKSNVQSYSSVDSIAAPKNAFVFTPTDATNILDPNKDAGAQEVLCRAITTTIDGNVKVTYIGSPTPVVVPFLAGVRRSMQCTKIWETSTTLGITSAGVIVEY